MRILFDDFGGSEDGAGDKFGEGGGEGVDERGGEVSGLAEERLDGFVG